VLLAHLGVQLAVHALAFGLVVPGVDATASRLVVPATAAYLAWLPIAVTAFVADAARIPHDADWHPTLPYYVGGSLLAIVGIVTTWEYLLKRHDHRERRNHATKS
jgi:hypothetical protein